MANHILEVTNLTKNYGDFVLDGVSFVLPRGTIMGLIGENGAGKTTTINCILNVVPKTDGEIRIFGSDHITDELSIKDKIGVVFDENYFPELFTPIEIGRYLAGIYSHWNTSVFHDYLRHFLLPFDKEIKTFSKGMKVKLSFAVALSHGAEFLVLDEATSGLDPIMRDDILDILIDFVQDESHSVLFSSHITSDLEKVADYITFIHKGKLVFSSRKDDLIDNYGVVVCDETAFNRLYKEDMIASRREKSQYRVLVRDRHKVEKECLNGIVESTTIEDIMLFYVKGEL